MRAILLLPLPAGLLLALASCGSLPNSRYLAGLQELELANYGRAYEALRQALALQPDDPRIQKSFREARILFWLDQGRRFILGDEEEKGLALLAKVLEEEPGSESALRWKKKGEEKFSLKLSREGNELLGRGKPGEAISKFESALEKSPDHPPSLKGLHEVGLLLRSQAEKAEEKYLDAIEAKANQDWQRVLYLARISRLSDPVRKDVGELLRSASRRQAEVLRERGDLQRREKSWAVAARNYKFAARHAEESGLSWADEVKGLVEEMEREAKAARLLGEAEIKVAIGSFKEARKLIEEARPICRLDLIRLNQVRAMLEAEEIRRLYLRARILRLDHRFEEALAIYKALVERDALGEARDRVDQIETLLERAGVLYQEAIKLEEKGWGDEAQARYKEIWSIHRRFRDVSERYRR